MVYSEDELRDAVRQVDDEALFFQGLDWDNSLGQWGQMVVPWREHNVNCWQNLFEVSPIARLCIPSWYPPTAVAGLRVDGAETHPLPVT